MNSTAIVRVERLERRLVLSNAPYTVTVPLWDALGNLTPTTITFRWDLTSPECDAALTLSGEVDDAAGRMVEAIQAAQGNLMGGLDRAVDAIDAYYGDSNPFFNWITDYGFALNQTLTTDPTAGVKLDPSVVDAASANARGLALLAQANQMAATTKGFAADINNPNNGVLEKVGKVIGYDGQVLQMNYKLRQIEAELKLVKQYLQDHP